MLGSAFNPPHLGHLVLAREAAAQLGLSRVLLVPTGHAPHKRIADDPGVDARLEMTLAAASGDELLEVEGLEVDASRDGDEPSYTYRTLEALSKRGDDLVWIMGADAAAGLGEWKNPERIIELARVAVADRAGTERERVESVLDACGAAGPTAWIEMPEIGVSSSLIRERVAAGRPIRYLVPERVRELIAERALYA